MYYDPSGYKAKGECLGKGKTQNTKNWKDEDVKIPEGHIMSPRDTSISANPIYREGPFTSEQRKDLLKGKSGGAKLSPHHRHQLPVRDGGVIDEIPGPGPENNF